jgi:hypothetical protein
VFLTCWLLYTFFWTPYLIREHFPAATLASQGTLNVERYLGWTEDIFRSPSGGAYINNNPGASLLGAVPLFLLRPVLIRVDEWNRRLPRTRPAVDDGELFWRTLVEGRAFYFLVVEFATVVFVMAPMTAWTAGYFYSRLAEAGVPAAHAAAAALLYGLGTPVFFRTAHLNHNLLVGDAGLMALLLLWDKADRPLSPGRAAVAGLLAGYAVLCDFSGLVLLVVAALYVWLRSARSAAGRWNVLLAYAVGAIPGVVALAVYQAWAFGSLYHPSQYYMTPTAPTSQGYRGFGWPSPALLWANFFDPRFGLFAYCPALALALAAPFARNLRYRLPKREMAILLTYFALFVLFCAANQYSWLQPSTGFRYLVPVVPALALLTFQTAQALSKLLRWIVAVAACLQSLIMAAGHGNTLPASLSAIWHRHGALLWMIRLQDAGLHTPSWLPLLLWASLAMAAAWIWLPVLSPGRRHGIPASANPNGGAKSSELGLEESPFR